MSRAEEWACLHLWPESIPPNQQWHEGDYHQKTASWRGPSPAAISKATVLHKYWPVLMARGRVRAKWMVSSPVLIKHQPALLIRNFFFLLSIPRLPLRFILQVHLLPPHGVQCKSSPTPQVKKRHIWCCIWFWVFLQELYFNIGCKVYLYPKKT